MKPTHWFVTPLYDILNWLFNLKISKHTPNQEKTYFPPYKHNFTPFVTPVHEIIKIKYEKVPPTVQHSLATASQIYAINISISRPSLDLILSPQRSQAGNGTGQVNGFSCGQRITSVYMEITTPNTRYEWRDQKCPSMVVEAEIKWQLQAHFLEWKCGCFELNTCQLQFVSGVQSIMSYHWFR